MKAQEIKVDIVTTPTEETAHRCKCVLEWFLNDNPDVEIIGEKINTENGVKTKLRFVNRRDKAKE